MNPIECNLEGNEEALKKIKELIEKFNIARSLAKDLADIEITIKDTRKKEIDEYIEDIRKDFVKTFGYEPQQLYLEAEGNSRSIRLILNET